MTHIQATWSDLVDLMRREPRPPFHAIVYEKSPAYEGRPQVERRVTVLHDGDAMWLIEEGLERRVVHTTDAVLYAPGKVEAFRGIGVASDSGIKALFHGRLRSSLPETTGTVVGTKELAGRSCWAVEAIWRSDDQSVALRLAIDQETGFVLEIVRPDMPEALIWVESIEIGTVTSDSSWQPKGPEHFPEEPPPPLPGQPRPFAVSPSMTDAELRNAVFGDELTNPADSP